MLNINKIFNGIKARSFGQREKSQKYINTKETHIDVPVPKKPAGKYNVVHSNRKRTRGRLIYFQIIRNHVGNVVKAIKHYQQKHDTNGTRLIPIVPTEQQMKENYRKCLQNWGCKEFSLPGNDAVTVWARDQKNADRKFRNLLATDH